MLGVNFNTLLSNSLKLKKILTAKTTEKKLNVRKRTGLRPLSSAEFIGGLRSSNSKIFAAAIFALPKSGVRLLALPKACPPNVIAANTLHVKL